MGAEIIQPAADDGLTLALTEAGGASTYGGLPQRPTRPGIPYAVVVDNPDTDPVILALAIRGRATCELLIPREKFDPLLLLDLIERHGVTMH